MQRLLITDRHGQDHTGESRGLGAQFVLTIWRFFLFSASFYHISTFFFVFFLLLSLQKKKSETERTRNIHHGVSAVKAFRVQRVQPTSPTFAEPPGPPCVISLDSTCFVSSFFSFFPIPPATHLLAFAVGTDRPTKLLRYAAALLPSSFIYLYLYRNIK